MRPMRPRQVRRLTVLMGIGCVLSGAVLGTAIGRADTTDGLFIDALDTFDVNYRSPAEAIATAHDVCDAFEAEAEFRAGMVVALNEFSMSDVGYVVGAAIGAYCPEFAYLVDPVAGVVAV